jgi:hypothetical protein
MGTKLSGINVDLQLDEGLWGNTNHVTTGRCTKRGQNVRWLRAAFGGGLIDMRPTTQIESGAFCFARQFDLP